MSSKTKTTLGFLILSMGLVFLLIAGVRSVSAVYLKEEVLATPRPTRVTPGPKATRTPVASATPTVTPPPGGSGSFQIIDSPNVGNMHNRLNSVSAVTTNDVWAVGEIYTNNGSEQQTLIEHWDGSSWQIFTSPNPDANSNLLLGVAAASSNDVWAVGRYGGSSGPNWQPLILRYSGTNWNIIPAPSTGSGAAQLTAIAARAEDDVWAVGSLSGPSTNWWEQPLILHWNGFTWNLIPSPQVGTSSVLYGVTALASDDAWAVGYTLAANYEALILHWNGTSWTQVPANTDNSARLFAVAAVSASDVWAVGSKNNFSSTLTLHWNGTQWNEVASPNGNYTGTNQHSLVGLVVVSTNEVWAVGSSAFSGLCGGSDAPHYWSKTLALLWNGISWQQTGSENPGPAGGCNAPRNDFYGVTSVNGQALTVGAYYDPNLSVQLLRTLVEQEQP